MLTGELRHVAAQMFRAHLVVRPDVAPLEHRPGRLNPVGVSHAVDVLLGAVPHDLPVRRLVVP